MGYFAHKYIKLCNFQRGNRNFINYLLFDFDLVELPNEEKQQTPTRVVSFWVWRNLFLNDSLVSQRCDGGVRQHWFLLISKIKEYIF